MLRNIKNGTAFDAATCAIAQPSISTQDADSQMLLIRERCNSDATNTSPVATTPFIILLVEKSSSNIFSFLNIFLTSTSKLPAPSFLNAD